MESTLKHEESLIQIAVLRWFKLQYPELDGLLVGYTAGINLGITARMRAKAMGLRAGMPDLQLYVPMTYPMSAPIEGFSAGLMIELKTKVGKISAIQREYHLKLRSQFYTIVICYSLEEAQFYIKEYLEGYKFNEETRVKKEGI